jgi:hypothetical protein
MAAYVDFALAGAARGDMVPFATVDARFDGIIRAHMPAADGVVVRDSAFYSLLADEWPTARDRLAARLLG